MFPEEQAIYDNLCRLRDERTPVILHAPVNPKNCRYRQVGLIDSVINTYKMVNHITGARIRMRDEPGAWILWPDHIRSVVWASEIRPANLRNPFKMNPRPKWDIPSKTYGADDRKAAEEGRATTASRKRKKK